MKWPIFAISLPDAFDRRETLSDQCALYGIDLEFVEAIDGRQGLPDEHECRIDRDGAFRALGHHISDGEFACALSHQTVYQRILADGLPGAIVLEDDAILTPEFAELVRSERYQCADFIQFNYKSARYFPWSVRALSPNVKVARSGVNAGLATGYSLSAQAAGHILSNARPLRGLADWPCDLQPLRPLITLPDIVSQPKAIKGHSTLEAGRRPLRDVPKVGRVNRFGRRAYWRRWLLKRLTRKIGR